MEQRRPRQVNLCHILEHAPSHSPLGFCAHFQWHKCERQPASIVFMLAIACRLSSIGGMTSTRAAPHQDRKSAGNIVE
jgi:hypothetical protein